MTPAAPDAARPGLTWRRKLYAAGLVGFTVVMIVTSFFGKKGVMDIARSRREDRALAEEVRALETRLAALDEEVRSLASDPAALEREARDKLWLVKPDEKVVILRK